MTQIAILVFLTAPMDDEARQEAQKLEGSWQIVSAEVRGEKMLLAQLGLHGVIFADTATTNEKRKIGNSALYNVRLSPSRSPKRIEAADAGVKGPAETAGVYELRDDTLRMCFGPIGHAPTELRTTKDSHRDVMLIELKHVKVLKATSNR
jgi:uncharacterized protein (TIGR03067 family)